MNKKNQQLSIILAILVIVAVALNWPQSSKRNTDLAVDQFAIEDTAAVSRVALSRQNRLVELTKSNNKWLTGKNFPVSLNLELLLMNILHDVQVNRPVSEAEQDSVLQALAARGTRVEVFSGSTRLKSFLVSGNPNANETWFMNPSEKNPYVVAIPGYREYLARLFELNEFQWRSRQLFPVDTLTFSSLQISYTNDPRPMNIQRPVAAYTLNGQSNATTQTFNRLITNLSQIPVQQYITENEFNRLTRGVPTVMEARVNGEYQRNIRLWNTAEATQGLLAGSMDNPRAWFLIQARYIEQLRQVKAQLLKSLE
jgi:hypothetical protein